MKKIYIFAAVLALLTLSLNAQMLPYKAIGKESVYQDKGKPGSTAGLFHAPAKINTANGEFLVGPYTTDDFSTTGKGLYNTTSYGRVEVSTVIPRSDIEQYIGQEIVGYRFATVGGTVSCYSFLVESEGPNYYIDDLYYWNIQSDGSYIDLSGNQWHEYYLDEPVVFQIPDTTQAIWIGYKYYQESSNNGSYTMTPIAVNPNVTSYECYAYSYNQNNQGFYDVTSTLGGAVAAQLIFKAPSTDPKITASPTSVSMSTTPGGTKTETVTVTGTNLTSGITATISGTDASLFSVSPASLGTSGGSLTVTYSPTAVGNHTATLTLSSTGAQDVVITLNGTCSSDITICDGTNTNDFLPIYGFYNDDYQINQMIYPESLLADLVGKTLTSMTFYANAALDANLSTTAWNVKLGTTNQTTFASSLSDITRLVPDDVTTVAEGYVITSGINTMTITFTTPFTYNGGNLLVDFQSTAEGQYKATTFYGVNQSTYTGYNSYRSSNSTPNQNGHYSSGGVRQFLPKVTFTFENNNKTPKPEITYVVNGDNVVITATGQGEVTLNVTGQDPVTSNGSASVTVPRTDTTYSVTATATAKDGDKEESDPATETITVPFLQTEKPTITYTTDGETVTITATANEPDANAEVTLTVGNGEPVTATGSVSVTVPCGVQSSSVTATATAQVNGKAQSENETAQITIPAGDGWIEMTETYDNPNDLLSFKVKVGNDTTDIMIIDQFLQSTVYNDHPSSYTYVLKETINGEEKSSNPATVPVYKTNSTMYSLYTEEEVLADNKYDGNKLKANVLNSEIDYDVVPDNNVLYYSLYRGGKDEPTPVVDVDHRISQLQKFEDKVGDNVTYYLTENHLSGITPRYEHIGSQIVERLDTNYVIGTDENKLSYVPVIWTFGLYTARGDGKNNSYGSDIKNSYLGKVNISVTGFKNDENNTTGQWVYQDGSADGITYCVYSPIITLNGFTPEDGGANDGDTYQYVPYMYRVWCTYTNAHNFTFLANPDGRKHLVDAGPIEAPFLIGEVTADDPAWNNNGEEVTIGRALASGEEQQPWSFGVPKTEDSKNVEFVARFYYKKIVTPAAQANGLRGNRGSERAFAIAQNSDDGSGIVTGISELSEITYVVSKTYVNAQGMQSDKPFDGLNIVVTRYSDGTTTTTKVVR
ncbi:MAG: hypothetical protein IJM58_08875 [Muribaculaceae bacterium]|nr:hypothetical protein [Muribaculaceae bacterium]